MMEKTAATALSSDWLTWLGFVFDIAGKLDWLNVLLILCGFVVLALLLVAQFRVGDGFDMRSMFAGRGVVSGRDYWTIEPGRAFQTGAFMVTTWGFVWVTTHDKLNELYLLVYVTLWAGSRAMNQIVASKFPVAPGTNIDAPPPPGPSVTTTTETKVTT